MTAQSVSLGSLRRSASTTAIVACALVHLAGCGDGRRVAPDGGADGSSPDGATPDADVPDDGVPDAAMPPAVSPWLPRGVGGGGALFDPSFSPTGDRLFVACDMTDLFRSDDLGRHWGQVHHTELQAGRGTRVAFTSDPNVLYVLDATDYLHPAPARSVDGGATWTRATQSAWPSDRTAYALFADLDRADRVLVAGFDTLWMSTDGGATFVARHTSTELRVAGAFFDGETIYVGTDEGLLVSTNGGASFAVSDRAGLPADGGMMSFAGAREGGTVRLAATIVEADVLEPGLLVEDAFGAFMGVYTLDATEAGGWTTSNDGITAGEQPVLVAMARDDVDVVYVAGNIDPDDDEWPAVYRSANGGQSWTSVFDTNANANIITGWSGSGAERDWSYGGGIIGLAVSPNDPDRVAITDYGFVHVTEDGGDNWRQGYVDASTENPAGASTPRGRAYKSVGLENTSVWDLLWTSADDLFAAFTDIRGIRSEDGGETWSFDYTGHTLNSMYRIVQHPNGTLYAATSSVHDLYQSPYLYDSRIDGRIGNVIASADGGRTWTLVHAFGRVVAWVELDPTNPSRAYAAVSHSADGDVYVTNDLQNGAASQWTRLPSPPRTRGHAYNVRVLSDGAVVASYSGHCREREPVDTGICYDRSGVFYLAPGASAWEDRSDAGMHYWTKDVVIDPHDVSQSTWYAGVFESRGPAAGLGGLYRTTDRGLRWTRIFANPRVESITVSPDDPDMAYVTTEAHGLFTTNDLRAAAPTFTPDLGYPFRQPLRVLFNPHDSAEVWVTSFGNGLRVRRFDAQRP